MENDIKTAIEALRQIILNASTTSSDINIIEEMMWRLRNMEKRYPTQTELEDWDKERSN